MLRLNARFAARLKEALKALVPDSTDHRGKCNRWRYGLQEDAERGDERRPKAFCSIAGLGISWRIVATLFVCHLNATEVKQRLKNGTNDGSVHAH